MSLLAPEQRTRAFRWLALGLVLAAAFTFIPMWAPLVLAAWVAVMAKPLLRKIAKALRGRHRAAGVLVLLLVLVMFVPLVLATLSLVSGAIDLTKKIAQSDGARSALVSLVSSGDSSDVSEPLELLSPSRVMSLVKEHGTQIAGVLGGVVGAASTALLGLFVFVYAVYVFLVDGDGMYAWLEEHAPLQVTDTRRIVAAFHETGRGLFVGVGLTGAAQGLIATITYFALGVPRALVLGLLTCVASLLPSIGTALVWVPVAVGLAFSHRLGASAVMVGVGVFAIGLIDNVLRPIFSRFGKLELSSFVLLTSMFGGLAAFGPWGLLLGPLSARLAKEALQIVREQRSAAADPVEKRGLQTTGDPVAPLDEPEREQT